MNYSPFYFLMLSLMLVIQMFYHQASFFFFKWNSFILFFLKRNIFYFGNKIKRILKCVIVLKRQKLCYCMKEADSENYESMFKRTKWPP